MNPEKTQIKIDTACTIGQRMEEGVESAKLDVARSDGAAGVAGKIAIDIEGLFRAAQKSIDAGELDLEQGKLVITWLTKAKSLATQQAAQASQNKLLMQGKVMALESAVQMVHRFKVDEESKVAQLQAAVASGQVTLEDAGRPAPPLKRQRQEVDELAASKARMIEEAAQAVTPVGGRRQGAKRAKNA